MRASSLSAARFSRTTARAQRGCARRRHAGRAWPGDGCWSKRASAPPVRRGIRAAVLPPIPWTRGQPYDCADRPYHHSDHVVSLPSSAAALTATATLSPAPGNPKVRFVVGCLRCSSLSRSAPDWSSLRAAWVSRNDGPSSARMWAMAAGATSTDWHRRTDRELPREVPALR
jgi:hypothetical protein